MVNDRPAEELLRGVMDSWRGSGPLLELERLVEQVWRTNVDRYEPQRLGDDPTCLGLQSARNICNLAERQLTQRPGLQVRGGQTLEVQFAGRCLHVGKVTADVWGVDWADSDVRDTAARANTAAYHRSNVGTLLETLPPVAGQRADPEQLRHLHLAWQGFLEDGRSRAWLGFPAVGEQPWFAVLPLFDTASARHGGLDAPSPAPSSPAPTFDQLDAAAVTMTVRRSLRAEPDPGSRA